MSRTTVLMGYLLLAIGGCRHAEPPRTSSALTADQAAPADPMVAERDGVHQGAYLLHDAVTDLHNATDEAKKLKAASKNADLIAALADVLDSLDDAGAGIADYTVEPPELKQFESDFANQDERRLNAINAANDALHDLDDIGDTLGDFSNGPVADSLNDLQDALDAAYDNLTEAIKSFGGKVEQDDTEDVTPAPGSDAKGAKPEL